MAARKLESEAVGKLGGLGDERHGRQFVVASFMKQARARSGHSRHNKLVWIRMGRVIGENQPARPRPIASEIAAGCQGMKRKPAPGRPRRPVFRGDQSRAVTEISPNRALGPLAPRAFSARCDLGDQALESKRASSLCHVVCRGSCPRPAGDLGRLGLGRAAPRLLAFSAHSLTRPWPLPPPSPWPCPCPLGPRLALAGGR